MSGKLHIGLIDQGGAGWMGGSEYIKNLVHALSAYSQEEPGRFEVSAIARQPVDEKRRGELSGARAIIELPARRHDLLGRFTRPGNRAFNAAVRNAGLDFVYPLTYDNEHNIGVTFPLGAGLVPCRWAGWIPDFQHREMPGLFSEKEISRRDSGIAALASEARTVVFSSEAAARDYRSFCPGASAKAEVLHFCTTPDPKWFEGDPVAVQRQYNLPDRFFLISNQLWQHKNHLLVLDALALLAARGIHPYVVCTGQPADFRDKNYINTVLQRIHERGVAGQVALLGLIARQDQIQLMRRCLAVVQPSLCEGWSTVVEDARALGKRQILSDLDVHKEQNPPFRSFFARQSAKSLADALAEVWKEAIPGPDAAAEENAKMEARRAQLAFGRRFIEIASAS